MQRRVECESAGLAVFQQVTQLIRQLCRNRRRLERVGSGQSVDETFEIFLFAGLLFVHSCHYRCGHRQERALLPMRDANPALTKPVVNWVIIAATAAVFLMVQPRDGEEANEFFYRQAAIPCEVTTGDPLTIGEIEGGSCSSEPGNPVFPEKSVFFAVLASMFFHGGWAHIIGNLWVLLIFGNNVEDAYGRAGFLILYLAAGLAATAGHILFQPASVEPVVGASGAIAGVMGAYLVLFPAARVVGFIPPFIFWTLAVPAWAFLGFWLIQQFFLAGRETNIAWQAHVAGFVAGVFVSLVLRERLKERIAAHQHRAWGGRMRWN